jgi:hypothetical protein
MEPAATSKAYFSDDELINDYIEEDFEDKAIEYDEAYMLEMETTSEAAPSTTLIDDRSSSNFSSPFKAHPAITNGVVVNPYTKCVSPERVS